ncbi:MAG: saccharopine dehydrogenase NADP-binding domain-containing protein [Bacteroidetes bacterium]|nr:saccharopine dehydrogenase NADP-binding domain-containing protein [Bacteroidota bacterium]MDA0903262.1 saccharopine dehydrogenase NADP-binding domain-containing protein [Bacteroidota bacterium]MDA1242179.1 saccharopine dehydrogenase NADP-binding domain-containing protein [Bacteroidota bacterium]
MEKVILVLGAGRSSSSLIQHLLSQAEHQDWQVHVGDLDGEVARRKTGGHPRAHSFAMSSHDVTDRDRRISEADLVISMLPASMHVDVAKVAIAAGVHVLTPSYISPEMKSLDASAKEAGVLVLNELGLDPGMDHMSAMEVMDRIREEGGSIVGFSSYCGGLVAPDSDDNPWHYKLSWNPRNVVLAGQGGTASFLEGGRVRVVPPHRVFQTTVDMEVQGRGYQGYPNRDSLSYLELYQLQGVKTLVRGTLRCKGFSESWDVLVQLGMVRDDVTLDWNQGISWNEWTRSFLPASVDKRSSVREAVAQVTGASDEALDRLAWLGLFGEAEGPARTHGTPAQIIESLVTEAWKLGPEDRDMIVMWHRFDYEIQGEVKTKTSSLCLEGKDSVFTAMSDTVGLPMALAAEHMLKGHFGQTGVQAPMARCYYEPLLAGLANLGISFEEEEW